ncbi:MAG: HD domain-containing protein [Candidatus Zixiibacteriota bacterium]
MKNQFVKNLKVGSELTELFVLRKKELKETFEGQRFLKLELGDKTGRIDGVAWDNPEELYDQAETGDIVKIKGWVTTYKEMPQIKVERLKKASEGETDISDFLPSADKDIDTLFQEFKKISDTIENNHLNKLMQLILEDRSITEELKKAPGGKLWHHTYVGGLLEHTLKVADICERAAKSYELINRDLLITGALLHDLGKIKGYSGKGFFDYTDEGRLIGHIISGIELVDQKLFMIEDFPADLALQLKHLIISHHGELEFASPVVPMTIEAIILHHADELDAQVNAFSRIIKTQKVKGKRWSDWVNLINRYIYLGEEEGKE